VQEFDREILVGDSNEPRRLIHFNRVVLIGMPFHQRNNDDVIGARRPETDVPECDLDVGL
jgi:hypothetical protein